MKRFEAYRHTNGRIYVKTLPRGVTSLFTEDDKKSAYLQKYLGIVEAENIVSAERKFKDALATRTELAVPGGSLEMS